MHLKHMKYIKTIFTKKKLMMKKLIANYTDIHPEKIIIITKNIHQSKLDLNNDIHEQKEKST